MIDGEADAEMTVAASDAIDSVALRRLTARVVELEEQRDLHQDKVAAQAHEIEVLERERDVATNIVVRI